MDLATRAESTRGLDASRAAAVQLAERLEQTGVDWLLLKGAALAQLLYDPGEHRGYLDIDVLVAPASLALVRRTLADLGYENRSEQTGIDNVLGAVHAEVWMRSGDAVVDLHWQLPGCGADPQTTWDVLYAGRTAIELGGRSIAVPGRKGLAMHLAMHAAAHGPSGGMALGDLSRGLERWPLDLWAAAARLAVTLDAAPTFAAGLRLLPRGADMARALGLEPTPRMSWTILHADLRPRGTFHLRALMTAGNPRAYASILRRSLLPRSVWIAREFPWARRGRLAMTVGYAAHLLRAPLWALRAARYAHLARGAERNSQTRS